MVKKGYDDDSVSDLPSRILEIGEDLYNNYDSFEFKAFDDFGLSRDEYFPKNFALFDLQDLNVMHRDTWTMGSNSSSTTPQDIGHPFADDADIELPLNDIQESGSFGSVDVDEPRIYGTSFNILDPVGQETQNDSYNALPLAQSDPLTSVNSDSFKFVENLGPFVDKPCHIEDSFVSTSKHHAICPCSLSAEEFRSLGGHNSQKYQSIAELAQKNIHKFIAQDHIHNLLGKRVYSPSTSEEYSVSDTKKPKMLEFPLAESGFESVTIPCNFSINIDSSEKPQLNFCVEVVRDSRCLEAQISSFNLLDLSRGLLDFISNVEESKCSVESKNNSNIDESLKILLQKDGFDLNEKLNMLTIGTPSVVQKSYGSEKRFFCPPPLVRLSGNLLEKLSLKKFDEETTSSGSSLSESMFFSSSVANQVYDDTAGGFATSLTSQLNTFIPTCSVELINSRVAMFRNMYMNDLVKRRSLNRVALGSNIVNPRLKFLCQLYKDFCEPITSYSQEHPEGKAVSGNLRRDFQLYLHINAEGFGVTSKESTSCIASRTISVISKPSKRKFSSIECLNSKENNAKNLDKKGKLDFSAFCGPDLITENRLVAIYHRLKSQSLTTKYLGLRANEKSKTSLITKRDLWNGFYLKHVRYKDFPEPKSTVIYDGAIIQLCSANHQWKSEPFRIRIVADNTNASEIESQSPLFQLYKVTLEYVNTPGLFLSVGRDQDLLAREAYMNFDSKQINERCFFTVVGVDFVDYRWFNPQIIPKAGRLSASPFPKIEKCSIASGPKDDQELLLGLEIQLPFYSMLKNMDIAWGKSPLSEASEILMKLLYNICLANVQLETAKCEVDVLTGNGNFVPVSYLFDETKGNGRSFSSFRYRIAVKIPALRSLVGKISANPYHGTPQTKLWKNFSQRICTSPSNETDISGEKLVKLSLSTAESLDSGGNSPACTIMKIPILLGRRYDGMIYPTRFFVKFNISNS